jgi:glucose/arabinose dehydrogenase
MRFKQIIASLGKCATSRVACLAFVVLGVAGVSNAQNVRLDTFKTGFSGPLALRHAGDASNRLFVVEQGGAIKIIQNGATLATNFLTMSTTQSCQWGGAAVVPGFTSGGERGLLGLAFHPQFASNRKFYVNFSDGSGGGHTTVAEFQASVADPNVANPASCKILLRVNQDFSNHNGGNVLFGPDGFLYIGMGDGGSGGDPCGRAQTLNPANLNAAGNCAVKANFTAALAGNANSRGLLGKLLRIDVNSTTAAGHSLCGVPSAQVADFAIPAANTFPGVVTKCPEVLAYGLRNPWRFSFDRSTGDLTIGDVGQNDVEEVSFFKRDATNGLVSGLNFGWNCFEGESLFSSTGSCAGASLALTHDPVFVVPHPGAGASLTGGYVYRGPVAALSGLYIAGDYIKNELYIASPQNLTAPGAAQPNWPVRILRAADVGTAGLIPTSFGEDEAGNVYMVDGAGTIYRFDSDTLLLNGFE